MQGQITIAILEHNETGFKTVESFLDKVFSQLNYATRVIRLDPGHWNPNAKKKNIFNEEVVDIFVSDLSLGKGSTFTGLDYIREIKELYPEIFVIGITRQNVSLSQTESRLPTADTFLYKPSLNSSNYIHQVSKRIHSLLAVNAWAKLDVDSSNLDGLNPRTDVIVLNRILRKITFSSHDAKIETAVSRIVLEPIIGGYSSSLVFRMSAFTKNNLQCINAVLKISKPEVALTEVENYKKYVEWYLPYTWRPQLIGWAKTSNFGAICYSFVYNDDIELTSINDHIRNKNIHAIDLSIEKIFTPQYQRWYHSINLKSCDESLSQYYFQRWFDRYTDSEIVFRSIVSEYDQHESNKVIIGGYSYPMPHGFLFGEYRGPYSTCIRHGDLHGGNILLTNQGDVSFIDFQDTGYGHVFEDFVVFESSIRLQFKTSKNFHELIEQELLEYRECKSDLEYSSLINKIRKYAKSNFPDESFSNYILGIACFSYRLLRLDKHLELWQKQQLVAVLLSSIRYLS